MQYRRACSLSLVFSILLVPQAAAQEFGPRKHDWPQWQGPARDGVSKETGLLQKWPADGPSLLWKVAHLGEGYSTPSVAGGRIFSMGNAKGKELVFCLREKDGSVTWTKELGPARRVSYSGTRCTPTVDGKYVYALGVYGDLACLNVADGNVVWRCDLRKDYGGRRGGWGYAESPLIDGDKLICTPGGSKAALVALNKTNGKLIWKCPIPEGYSAGYSSVRISHADGLRQYVQFLGRAGRAGPAAKGAVVGVRAKDGAFMWSFNKPGNRTANISTPVVLENYVFAASGYGTGGALAKLQRAGDKATAEVLYFSSEMQNHHGGMVLVDGYLYGSGKRNQLYCLDFKSGKIAWGSRKPGKGSIFYADKRFYYRNERDGRIYLIEATPKGYVEHGRLTQIERSRSRAWAHPFVANGRLYIADQNVLLCFDVKAKK